ncbi:hypothetical protein AB840_11530 [Megasphaera cerevisiae DSM 20462]|uniref:DUF2232 domain-containing protein n=1 Tax=Megasphaera cerevisiae DSM 20462 TaxID=1122219 RepID=A0A0J6ZLQ0_9FIRM|nr:YybS family protein [Megasphaera cerevisiae]KMO85801.1 hypothetical protein AB840_11530 [Megasphaera cerevisiae DSM 20462]SJZ71017.1 Uncharacterized conserved protein YybS, DUF2232 family [Megasphaera cerevisiae DSM 20462]
MEQKRATPLTTAGCFAAVMLILALLSTYVPIFSFIGYFIMPIPISVTYMKYGIRQALLLGITAGILMGIFIDPLTAVIQLLTFGSVGIAVGAGFRHEWPPVRMLLGVTAALIGTAIVLIGLVYAVMDINVITTLGNTFNMVVDNMLAQYKNSGMSEIQLAEANVQLEQVRQMLPVLMPMVVCLAAAVIAYINIKVSQVMLIRLGFSVRPFLPIRYWEISRSMIYLYILAIVMKYWGTTRDIQWLNIIGINLNQMAFFFICIQGIAFAFYFLDRRFKIGTGVQALLLVMFFVLPVFSYLAFIIGIIDMLVNYRKKQGMP